MLKPSPLWNTSLCQSKKSLRERKMACTQKYTQVHTHSCAHLLHMHTLESKRESEREIETEKERVRERKRERGRERERERE